MRPISSSRPLDRVAAMAFLFLVGSIVSAPAALVSYLALDSGAGVTLNNGAASLMASMKTKPFRISHEKFF